MNTDRFERDMRWRQGQLRRFFKSNNPVLSGFKFYLPTLFFWGLAFFAICFPVFTATLLSGILIILGLIYAWMVRQFRTLSTRMPPGEGPSGGFAQDPTFRNISVWVSRRHF